MLHKNLLISLKTAKNIFIDIIINHLNKMRYSINNHTGSSREISLIYEYSDCSSPNQKLCDLISDIYKEYNKFDETFESPKIYSKIPSEKIWDSYFPRKIGEHYRLIPLIINLINASQVIEIGTFRGASAKSILKNTSAKLHTFDIQSWDKFNGTYLNNDDFKNNLLKQTISDLSLEKEFKKFSEELLETDFIFIDGPKNYNFEKTFLSRLFKLYSRHRKKEIFILMDDVKLSTMAKIWQSINHPKCILDMVGHWSGSGLIYIPKKTK
tara:strand:+ start:587 stop:1390 length:804 start_codon:yes stop_codon:yes gene_type:complete